ncbi:MAG: radical SAM family heme chaperone HemW, partial [Phycisphaerales bacterium]|nr:radical SAM family heme chaperone HemW [Phycisphaerales bacterium]
ATFLPAALSAHALALTPGSDSLTGPLYVRSAYLHIPFCFHKCHYCDFYSIVDNLGRENAFVDRMIDEITAVGQNNLRPLDTLFVGGGTPTLLGIDSWQRLIPALHAHLPPADDHEWSIEANPETVTPELARCLVAGGFNRVSIGAQSFQPGHLKTLERWHDPANVGRSVDIMREAGISAVSLDLIFGIPGQSLDDWQMDLETALHLAPDHLSCYGLTYEPNTAMTVRMQRGDFEPIDNGLEAAMYELTMDRLAAAGYEHYEISNWAKPGRACRHNLAYWRNEDWLALGPSASGHLRGLRWKNVPRLTTYLENGPWPPVMDVECVDDTTRIGERLMLGLRLREGIARSDVTTWFAHDPAREQRTAIMEQAEKDGYLEWVDDRVRFTRAGMLMADGVLSALI